MHLSFANKPWYLGIMIKFKIFKNHHWTNYFFAAMQGLVKYNESEIDVATAISELVKRGKIQIVVDGTVPIGSGLSRYMNLPLYFLFNHANNN